MHPSMACLRSRTLRQLCPGLLLATGQSQCHVSQARRESTAFHSSPQPQRPLPPAGPRGHICREPACPSGVQTLTRRCLISALINRLSLAFLSAADFCFGARATDSAAPAGKGAARRHQHHLFHELIRPRGKARSCRQLRESVSRSGSPEKAGRDSIHSAAWAGSCCWILQRGSRAPKVSVEVVLQGPRCTQRRLFWAGAGTPLLILPLLQGPHGAAGWHRPEPAGGWGPAWSRGTGWGWDAEG